MSHLPAVLSVLFSPIQLLLDTREITLDMNRNATSAKKSQMSEPSSVYKVLTTEDRFFNLREKSGNESEIDLYRSKQMVSIKSLHIGNKHISI